MERLEEDEIKSVIQTIENAIDCATDEITECDLRKTLEFLKELQYYRGLKKQGRLLELPCKIGDTVYCIMTSIRGTHPTIFSHKFNYSMIESFGKTVFLTREEAEQSLKEMEEKE